MPTRVFVDYVAVKNAFEAKQKALRGGSKLAGIFRDALVMPGAQHINEVRWVRAHLLDKGKGLLEQPTRA